MCLLILTRSSGKLRAVTAAHWRKNNNVHLREEGCQAISFRRSDIPRQFILCGSFESNHKSVTFNFSSSETSCADAVLTSTGLNSVKMQSSRHQERCGHVLSALCSRRFTWTLYIFAGDQNYDEILTNWNSRQSSCHQV